MSGIQLDLLGVTVWFIDGERGWISFRAKDVDQIRTLQLGGKLSNGSECKDPCFFSDKCHFMITSDGISFTKLCTLDVIRYKPFKIPKGLLQEAIRDEEQHHE
jgi:hypothetical protein